MASLDSLKTRYFARNGIVREVYTDTPIAIRLRYVGTGTVTSVTVTTATNIVMITSDGETDTYTFATYTSYGALADAINGDGIFEARVIDGLRSKASASTIVDGAISAGTDDNNVTVWDALQDTSASLQFAVCLTPHLNWDYPNGHTVKLQQVVYSINMGTAAADSFQVFRRRGTTESKIVGALSVDTTETTLTFASGEGFISGQPDDEYVVLVKDAATLANSTSNFLRIVGALE